MLINGDISIFLLDRNPALHDQIALQENTAEIDLTPTQLSPGVWN